MMMMVSGLSLAQSYDLKLNLEKGKTYTAVQESKNVMVQKMQGQEIPVNMDMNIDYSVKVLDKTANTYKLETVYNYFGTTVEVMGQKKEMNSKMTDGDDVAKFFNSLVGKKVIVYITDKGKVTKIEGNKEIVDQLKKNAPDNPLLKNDNVFKIYTDDGIKNTFQNMYSFPEKSVKIGDTWTAESTNNNGFDIVSKTTYTLTAADSQNYTVTSVSEMNTVPNQVFENQGMQIAPNLTGKGNSETKFNKTTGWVTTGTTTTEMSGDLTLKNMGDMKMDMNMKSTATITGK